MGRTILKSSRKEERIMVRVTSSEKEKLEKILDLQNKKIAHVLRDFIKNYITAYEILIKDKKED